MSFDPEPTRAPLEDAASTVTEPFREFVRAQELLVGQLSEERRAGLGHTDRDADLR